jgi:DNA-binding response OmpR family regulator
VKILVVEDEKNILDTIVTYLAEEGYLCEQASTFDLGSQKINLYEYDC